ncbi:SHOCT domain-containing protein [Pseudonocardia sp. GCM10023141]|uniref:SHOCT domain-containing protein n=1 Tax=Pseudonocardia sp. GCM10023141 TaxID=3252653 RepID=UPI003620C488
MNGWMAAGMGLWGLVLIVVVIAVLALAVLGGVGLVRGRRAGDVTPAPEDDARQRLRLRYAAGEIDDEEYERRLSALTWH